MKIKNNNQLLHKLIILNKLVKKNWLMRLIKKKKAQVSFKGWKSVNNNRKINHKNN
jgi:hypothetical protein